MEKLLWICGLFYLIVNGSCTQEVNPHTNEVEIIATPCEEGGESNLYVSSTGNTYLSWIEYVDDSTDALIFSRMQDDIWSEPKEIARGSNWFVNWADFPSLVVYGEKDQYLAAHWLQKSDVGTFDYDVRISMSSDGGATWGESFIVHEDGVAAEHGFASLLPLGNNDLMAVWLDGRNTGSPDANEENSSHGHHGEMTLRTAAISPDGKVDHRRELDPRICDCCQTSAVAAGDDVVVAYRDRSIDEIRDISVVRMENGWWHDPQPISKDGWKIAGCPVNGPALSSYSEAVALAWYTTRNDSAMVFVAFSQDGGKTFGESIRVDDGLPKGRVDVEMVNENEVYVSWIEEGEDEIGGIKVKRIDNQGVIHESSIISSIGTARSSGFPRMAKRGDDLFFSWTDVQEGKSSVKTARLAL